MKKIIVFALSAVFLTGAFAVATPASAVTLQEMQNQIQFLLEQVKQLEIQNQTANVVGALTSSTTIWCFDFRTNLDRGDKGTSVAALHNALELEGLKINQQEKDQKSFGLSTGLAVINFQEKYQTEVLTPFELRKGTGYVGVATRAKLNQLYGCKNKSSVSILSPNGGETLNEGKRTTIKWQTHNLPSDSRLNVKLLRSDESVKGIFISLHPNQQALSWDVDSLTGWKLKENATSTATTSPFTYKIFVEAYDMSGGKQIVADTSDGWFGIVKITPTKSNLNQTQINAIINLLQAFGASQSAIDNVKAVLEGR